VAQGVDPEFMPQYRKKKKKKDSHQKKSQKLLNKLRCIYTMDEVKINEIPLYLITWKGFQDYC
jgi:hypothetical protein